jgi:hypothetical protein
LYFKVAKLESKIIIETKKNRFINIFLVFISPFLLCNIAR